MNWWNLGADVIQGCKPFKLHSCPTHRGKQGKELLSGKMLQAEWGVEIYLARRVPDEARGQGMKINQLPMAINPMCPYTSRGKELTFPLRFQKFRYLSVCLNCISH
jgi:hypothetical protein